MNDIITYSYTAGIIDGEGTVTLSVRNSGKYRSPVVSVTSTTYELLEFLKTNYGGTIRKQKVYKEHHKQSWCWNVINDGALNMLQRVKPYMREPKKIKRSEHLLSNYKNVTVRNGKYTAEQAAFKLKFESEFFEL